MLTLILATVLQMWAKPIRSEIPNSKPVAYIMTCPTGFDLYYQNLALSAGWVKVQQPYTTHENARNFSCQPVALGATAQ